MWKRKQWFVALVAASEDSQTHTETHKERGKARRVSKRISRRCCERNEASHTHANALKPQCILGHVWGVIFCSISPTKSLGSFVWGCVCLVEFILYGKTCQDNFSGRYLLKWHCAMIDKLMNCLYPCSSGFRLYQKVRQNVPLSQVQAVIRVDGQLQGRHGSVKPSCYNTTKFVFNMTRGRPQTI